MNVSFKGMFSQAIKQVEDAQKILDGLCEIREKLKEELPNHCLYDENEGEKLMEVLDKLEDYEQEYQMFLRFPTLICHDVILGLATEKCTAEELRKFMFGGASIEEISKIPTKDLVSF